MISASEISPTSTVGPYVKNVEMETFLILSKISEQKEFLKNILEKYNAKSPGDIETMVEQGEIDEHPGYEDYLSALSCEENIKDLKEMVGDFVKRL